MTCSTVTPDDMTIVLDADFSGMSLAGTILQLDNNLTAVHRKIGCTIQRPINGVITTIMTLHSLSGLISYAECKNSGRTDTSEQIFNVFRDK